MKKLTKVAIEVGDEVAFNTLPDAVWFEVVKVDGFALTVREGPGYREQVIDKGFVEQRRDKK